MVEKDVSYKLSTSLVRITFEISIDPHFHSLLFKSFGLPSYSPQSRKIHTEAVGGGEGLKVGQLARK